MLMDDNTSELPVCSDPLIGRLRQHFSVGPCVGGQAAFAPHFPLQSGCVSSCKSRTAKLNECEVIPLRAPLRQSW